MIVKVNPVEVAVAADVVGAVPISKPFHTSSIWPLEGLLVRGARTVPMICRPLGLRFGPIIKRAGLYGRSGSAFPYSIRLALCGWLQRGGHIWLGRRQNLESFQFQFSASGMPICFELDNGSLFLSPNWF